MEIKIKEEIREKLKKRVESDDEFKDVEEYVNYILKQVVERLKNEAEEEPAHSEEDEEVLSKEEEEQLKEKLKYLGYL